MLLGGGDFRLGQTLTQRVPQGGRMMRRMSGWTGRRGPLEPEGKPERTSNAALTGTMLEQVILPFRDADGLSFIVRDVNEKVRVLDPDGDWSSATGAPTFSVIKDAQPFRLGPLAVFPTEEGLMVYEKDSTTTKSRPLGLKSPEDYVEGTKLTVTRSTVLTTQLFDIVSGSTRWAAKSSMSLTAESGTNDRQYLFMGNDGAGAYPPASTLIFTFDLGATPVDFTGKKFLVLDLALSWLGADPVQAIVKSGDFLNKAQQSSGFEFILYDDQACTSEIARYAIPQITSDGIINRVAIELGTISETDVKGLGIATAACFVPPIEGHGYYLWMHSSDFDASWEFAGNVLCPAVKFNHSPWAKWLPSDSGTKTATVTSPSSASILETFPLNLVSFSPDHPLVKWQYDFRGRSALSINDYDVMVSDPSEESMEYFADPWRVYLLTVTLPEDSGTDVLDEYGKYVTNCLLFRKVYDGLGQDKLTGELGVWSLGSFCGKPSINMSVACTLNVAANTITSAAHGLYIGAIVKFGTTVGGITAGTSYYVCAIADVNTFSISTAESGSALDITGSEGAANTWNAKDLFYYDIGRIAYGCTLVDSGDKITTTGHKFYIGDIVTFGTTTGNITKDRPYYVITTADWDTFQVSATVDGTAVVITAGMAGSNTVSSAGKDLTIDELDIPQYIPLNRAIPDEARYAVPAHNRVYTAHLGYDSVAEEWTRQTMMGVCNLGDYAGWPVEAVDLAVDGQELGKFSPESFTIRGLLEKDNFVYASTERGVWELVGTDASSPWQFLRRSGKGWVSGKTAADCGSEAGIIAHGPEDDGFYSYVGGRAIAISDGIIDSPLIDWTKAHQGVSSKGRYVFFCRYDDPDEDDAWALWIYDYDVENGGWHSSHDECYEFAAMCVDEATGDVYALTHDGDIVEVFGGTTSYGSDEPVYKAEYQHIIAAPPTQTRQTVLVAADIITAETSIEMELTVSRQGKGDSVPVTDRTVTITADQTQYRWRVGVDGDGFAAKLVYRGTTPPRIPYFIIDVNDMVKA